MRIYFFAESETALRQGIGTEIIASSREEAVTRYTAITGDQGSCLMRGPDGEIEQVDGWDDEDEFGWEGES